MAWSGIRSFGTPSSTSSYSRISTPLVIDSDSFVELFKLPRRGPDLCLPVRVHDGYLRLSAGSGALAVRLSEATPCPGTTVQPEPAEQTPL